MGKERVSIYHIAKEAGVSPATVSRVLTHNANVSDEKRIRVEELILKYDFRPNAMARGLSNTQSKIIGLLAPDIRNPFYANLAVECERAASESGYILMLCNSMNNLVMEEYHLQKMFEQRVDALILMGGRVDELVSDEEYVEKMNQIAGTTPVVITGKLDGSDCFQVNIDEAQAMDKLMEYLIHNGHSNICLMGGRKNVNSTYSKRIRYRGSLRKYGIPFRTEYMVETQEYSLEAGYQAMNDLFDSKIELPTAIIAINDLTALGIVQSIRQHSLRIPEDISVASFDNTFLAASCTPRLTSVGYNYDKFGDKLVETAIAALEGKNPEKLQLIPPELVVRESCRSILTEGLY
ncbi:LacI family DNA-binding transcriptional regulator [Anaerocolumna sp. AGMB13025]|uniref:LacI family DNA-binding transcriptional regulator n=1 Tax=Anaerocolumna sp. AGMB13025 TaxID=3039116 RepID=UPI00241FED1D|nr:LacI family DNA-binding transcriptional regulator [Anaerocolumna sp. AGMB13025]WFR55238.1 LacI family DNA-binding transcriptional regulator [Anaerocolumna sp. AGMB13025]